MWIRLAPTTPSEVGDVIFNNLFFDDGFTDETTRPDVFPFRSGDPRANWYVVNKQSSYLNMSAEGIFAEGGCVTMQSLWRWASAGVAPSLTKGPPIKATMATDEKRALTGSPHYSKPLPLP